METDGPLPHSQEPAIIPYPEPHHSNTCSDPISWRSTLILSSHLCTGAPSELFPSGFPAKTLSATLYLPKCATTIPFVIWSPEILVYVMRCIDHIALLHAVFSIPVLPCPSDPQITKYA